MAEDVIGKSYDSEIFYYESIIYMEVLKYLLDKDYKVLQCYDCWYCNKEANKEDINKIIKDKVYKYYNK